MKLLYSRRPTIAAALLFTVFGLFFEDARADYTTSVSGQINHDEPWRIEADQISYSPGENEYIAKGDVVITHLDSRLSADEVRFRSDEGIARASGNVFFEAGEDTLQGDRLVINMAEETGTLYTGRIFIRKTRFHIQGDRIMKTGARTYYVDSACLTTCDPDKPDWSITGSKVNVTIEGYGTVKHAAFRIRNIPVFYVPYFVFPAKIERQSGLLIPNFHHSDKNGFEYIQPFFWAISDHSDATFYYHHIQNRGEKFGAEYRYMANGLSKGTLMIDGFEDRKMADDDESNEKWGYTGDRELRPNSGRYWFRMKADQELGHDVMARLDLDIVSDQDYLREFRRGYTGFSDTQSYFESEFDRGIDDRNERTRENRLNINRNWMSSSLNADAVWYDDVVKRRLRDENDTIQRLPMISYNLLKQPLGGSGAYGSARSEYTYFFREDGETGHRADLHPRLSRPFYPLRHLTFEPYAGYRQTAWYSDADREDIGDRERYKQRGLYDLGAELTTDFHRIFPVDSFGAERVKHGVIPQLRYSYTQDKDQSEFPDFDETDRIDPENLFVFSVTNLFTARRTIHLEDADPQPVYNRFARFMVEQPYNLDYEDSDEAFLPIYAELDITPKNYVTFHADASYSHSENHIESGNLSLRLRNILNSRFRVDYRYTRERNESLLLQAEVPLRHWLTAYGGYEHSLRDNRNIETSLGLRYLRDCWSIDVSYNVEEDIDGTKDRRYFLQVHLYGLGEIGN